MVLKRYSLSFRYGFCIRTEILPVFVGCRFPADHLSVYRYAVIHLCIDTAFLYHVSQCLIRYRYDRCLPRHQEEHVFVFLRPARRRIGSLIFYRDIRIIICHGRPSALLCIVKQHIIPILFHLAPYLVRVFCQFIVRFIGPGYLFVQHDLSLSYRRKVKTRMQV